MAEHAVIADIAIRFRFVDRLEISISPRVSNWKRREIRSQSWKRKNLIKLKLGSIHNRGLHESVFAGCVARRHFFKKKYLLFENFVRERY